MEAIDKAALEKGRKYCLRLFSIRARTEKELKDRLGDRGYAEGEVARLVRFFMDKGLLDDLGFAREWIDNRARTSPRSRNLLRDELEKKGVPAGLIDKAFESVPGLRGEKEIALSLIEKNMKGSEPPAGDKIRGKFFRLLLQKGFDIEIAEEAVREFFGNE